MSNPVLNFYTMVHKLRLFLEHEILIDEILGFINLAISIRK